MSAAQAYELDVGAASVVALCQLCAWRGIGIDRGEARILAQRHLIRWHPASAAGLSSMRAEQRRQAIRKGGR